MWTAKHKFLKNGIKIFLAKGAGQDFASPARRGKSVDDEIREMAALQPLFCASLDVRFHETHPL
jgi:hypothetical protein